MLAISLFVIRVMDIIILFQQLQLQLRHNQIIEISSLSIVTQQQGIYLEFISCELLEWMMCGRFLEQLLGYKTM